MPAKLTEEVSKCKTGAAIVDAYLDHFAKEFIKADSANADDCEQVIRDLQSSHPDLVTTQDIENGITTLHELIAELGVEREERSGEYTGQTKYGYKFGSVLGKGGQGCVYHAKKDGISYAIKVFEGAESWQADFKNDFSLIKSESSTNRGMVTLHERHFEEMERLFVVMEFVHGSTLKANIGSSWIQASHLTLAYELANIVRPLHNLGLIVRDIKSSNIMIGHDSKLRLIDLDMIGRERAQGFALRRSRTGTPTYMSPEAKRGRALSAASDVFSIGLVIFELATGLTYADCSIRQRWKAFRLLPKTTRHLISNCTKAKPKYRYQSAEELCNAIDRASDNIPIRPKSVSNFRSKLRFHSVATTFVLMTAIALVVGVSMYENKPLPVREEPKFKRPVTMGRWNMYGPPDVVDKMWAHERWEVAHIETNPPGAHVAFVRLEQATLEPIVDTFVIAPMLSPVSQVLSPGNYLVIAWMPGNEQFFHEVYRRMPIRGEKRSGDTHMRFMPWGLRPKDIGRDSMFHEGKYRNGHVSLPPMRLFDSSNFSDMSDCETFLIDETEVSVERFKLTRAWFSQDVFDPPTWPRTYVRGATVRTWLEDNGKRLPTIKEYYWIAEQSENAFPLDESSSRKFDRYLTEVRTGPNDVIELPSGDRVYGLFTNADEFTANLVIEPKFFGVRRLGIAVFYGNKDSFLAQYPSDATLEDYPGEYLLRQYPVEETSTPHVGGANRFLPYFGIGFRGARSKWPRNSIERLRNQSNPITHSPKPNVSNRRSWLPFRNELILDRTSG